LLSNFSENRIRIQEKSLERPLLKTGRKNDEKDILLHKNGHQVQGWMMDNESKMV